MKSSVLRGRLRPILFGLILGLLSPAGLRASEAITSEPDGASYHFVSHYRVLIDAPVTTVWSHLIDLGSWMFEFEMSHVAGTPGQEGEVRRLYSGQDFFMQITHSVPEELLVIANLPSTSKGEISTGIGVMSLVETDGRTTVDLTMSRRYSWDDESQNPMQQVRESPEFIENTRAMWEDRFLQRLRSLSEQGAVETDVPG
jgi:hypothetical protein